VRIIAFWHFIASSFKAFLEKQIPVFWFILKIIKSTGSQIYIQGKQCRRKRTKEMLNRIQRQKRISLLLEIADAEIDITWRMSSSLIVTGYGLHEQGWIPCKTCPDFALAHPVLYPVATWGKRTRAWSWLPTSIWYGT
jgi:hypothetical protein